MTDARSLGILVFEGFEELDAIGPYEVFQIAAEYGTDISTLLGRSRRLTPSMTAGRWMPTSVESG